MHSLTDIRQFISSKELNSNWVIQKYLEKPLLYNNRKFDIRVWVVITCDNELYVYKEGYLRTSSDSYTLSSSENWVHLTNNCLQKHGVHYGEHEEGNTLGFEAFRNYLKQVYAGVDINFDRDIIPRIHDLIIDTFLAIKNDLNKSKRKNCFELLGYDFMIDEDFRTWLIEVNVNPYLGIPNDYIRDLLPKMIDDMFQLVLYPHYPPFEQPTHNNDYILLFKEKIVHSKKVCLNKRRPFNSGLPIIVVSTAQTISSSIPSTTVTEEPVASITQYQTGKPEKESPMKVDSQCAKICHCLCNYASCSEQEINDSINLLKKLFVAYSDKLYTDSNFKEIISYGIAKLPANVKDEIWKIVDLTSKDFNGRIMLTSREVLHSLINLVGPLLKGESDKYSNEALNLMCYLQKYKPLRSPLIKTGAISAVIEVIYKNERQIYAQLRREFEANLTKEDIALLKATATSLNNPKPLAMNSSYRIHSTNNKLKYGEEKKEKSYDKFRNVPMIELKSDTYKCEFSKSLRDIINAEKHMNLISAITNKLFNIPSPLDELSHPIIALRDSNKYTVEKVLMLQKSEIKT
jgi:hypothetical protein